MRTLIFSSSHQWIILASHCCPELARLPGKPVIDEPGDFVESSIMLGFLFRYGVVRCNPSARGVGGILDADKVRHHCSL